MVKPNKIRVVKTTSPGGTSYAIQVKVMFWWVRYNDYDYATLEDALKVVNYKLYTQEQVWP